MTDCTDPRWNELLGAYALGACTPDERDGLRAHLDTCAACTADLLELGAAREALLTAVTPASAPPELKSRVMSQVRADAQLFAAARERETGAPAHEPARERPRGRGWLRRPVPLAAALASAALLAVGAGALGAALVGDADGPAGTRTVAAQVDGTQAPGARADLVIDGSGDARLVVDGLPSPGRGRVWQVWLRTGADAPRPAGALFGVDAAGNGAAAVPGPLDGIDEVLVSSEPTGGSQQPTRTPILAAPV